MSRYMEEKWPWIDGSHGLRTVLMELLSDADLTFNPGGDNMSLGALCRQMGEIEYSYLQSLKTFKQDWSYRNTDAGLESNVARLKAWYQTLDVDLKATISAFPDQDFKRTIDRGSGFVVPVEMQLDIYLQALLIFFGKATIYMKAMNKVLPPSFKEYIG